jgi:hypothetical protein
MPLTLLTASQNSLDSLPYQLMLRCNISIGSAMINHDHIKCQNAGIFPFEKSDEGWGTISETK